ncbi:N-acetylglucosamine-specific PTS transporter subunit IIBC [Vibrio sonorensis]|uniref:N-acetylglucosamine-specific PTS transporter subunit IIBC n=1 Tax=Vibrio sonorensis TaxID=1004316 RepID=UPI0008D916D8|nr:N-acetylglucosamine-specific PTS transporter subunit IIBC [Vibrio sonorensis]
MNILGYLQKIGKALMVPIAVMPAAALLIGLNYAMEGGNAVSIFLGQAGNAILGAQGWLFALGVAYGLAKDNNGAAALSAFVGLTIVNTLLDPAVSGQFTGVTADLMSTEDTLAFSQRANPFIGVLVGVITGELYNRYSNVQFPAVLAFFSGKRFVPLLTCFMSLGLSLFLLVIWPTVYGALVAFGKSFVDLGAAGAGLFGFFNRLLIPTGLHHALNQIFWFDLAGINDLGNFWSGQGTLGETGMYMAGFFPVMGYGLPAAGFAIYQCAKPENKAKVGSLMLAAGGTAFITGVTEPIEFAFMFAAPVLFVIHAALTALSMFVAASMGWMAGFGFSGGMIDFILSFSTPLANKPFMLVAQGLVFAFVYYSVFRFAIIKFDLKTPGREDESDDAESEATAGKTDIDGVAVQYLEALGGHANLESIDYCITRLRLTLKDKSVINEKRIKELGAMGIVHVGEKNLQVIIGAEAELVASAMEKIPAV